MSIALPLKSSETVAFAASELDEYLGRMVDGLAGSGFIIKLNVSGSITVHGQDAFRIKVSDMGGLIEGNNDRSVLLGVYDYLHYLGCRFLAPQKECELVPRIPAQRLAAEYSKEASFSHRGVCIEGADSFENIRDFISWLPKLGYNSFFLQFKVPYTFLARWYNHEQNPFRGGEGFSPEEARICMELLETEVKKRGLLLHKVGHGWTGEVLGYETASWEAAKRPLSPEAEKTAAMLGGVRGLYRGVPANTNLCYSSDMATDRFAELVAGYAQENPQVDYLHIWLADEYNNVCECEECRKTTVSDQYVRLLNEIDRRLTEKKLNTRIVFLLYQELLWPPLKERLANRERFVLMFAPISRTFAESYSCDTIPDGLPEFVRNNITLPTSLGENLAFLKSWQRQFDGSSFVYDYPLGRAHYGDFGYVHISRVISGDIKKLRQMGMDGYISCQELRAALPNALPNYVMGYTLFSEDTPAEAVIDEYYGAAYGGGAGQVKKYLTRLSELSSCDYVNGKGPRFDEDVADRMRRIGELCEAFADNTAGNGVFWELLEYHRGYIMKLSKALYCLANGDNKAAGECREDMRRYICSGEDRFQPYLDVYRVLEVTQKYTGFT